MNVLICFWVDWNLGESLGKDLQASGLKSLTEIMNVVVPPISEHEIIEVQLSYDMIGYDGIETLVYRSLSKVNSFSASSKQPFLQCCVP